MRPALSVSGALAVLVLAGGAFAQPPAATTAPDAR